MVDGKHLLLEDYCCNCCNSSKHNGNYYDCIGAHCNTKGFLFPQVSTRIFFFFFTEPKLSNIFSDSERYSVFESCPECAEYGIANALYLHDDVVSCPAHGEVRDSRRMAEYRQRGSQFLLGKAPTQTPPALSNEGSA